jgi:CheY-like chemotaxis protein
VLNLNDVVLRMQGMLQRLLGEDVKLSITTDAALAPVRFDPGQAEQVLVNLAANARDAMPNGGELTLETSNVTIDASYTGDHPDMPPGQYVRLAVSDTGEGMADDIREHAFEPFFTTKEIGRGTGLGLAMIHGAVLQNGGRVEVYSEPQLGTSFKIFLPAVANEESTGIGTHASSPPRGTETILLVEDDDTLRALARRLLLRQDYTVYDFPNGPAALHWLRGTRIPIHLLFTDVIMPEMNGKLLGEQVVAIRPEIRVLFASGYTANVIVHHGVLNPDVEFLAKPYSISALAQKVRDVLDRPVSPSADR